MKASSVRYLSDGSRYQAVKIYTSRPQWGPAQPHSVHQNKQPFFVSQAAQAGAGLSSPLSSNLFPFSFNFRLQSRVPAPAVTLRGSSIQ